MTMLEEPSSNIEDHAAVPVARLNQALDGRYRIERELGEGGMATVYLAHDERHRRQVALKVLQPELAAVLGGERFLAEVNTTARLQHLGQGADYTLYDVSPDDGRFLMLRLQEMETRELILVLNWLEELKQHLRD
jgi:serine/threonine protein kinase